MLRELSVAEQRYAAVLAVIEDGVPITAVAEKAGVSRQTVHSWLSRYAGGGLEALADRSHRPRSCPHQMEPAVEVRLVELRGLHPGWGPDRLLYRPWCLMDGSLLGIIVGCVCSNQMERPAKQARRTNPKARRNDQPEHATPKRAVVDLAGTRND